MKHVLVLVAAIAISACSSMSAKPKVVYNRTDLGEVENKVVVFPTMDFNGKKSEGAGDVNSSILASWSKMYGSDKIIPAGPVADKVGKAYPDFYLKLVKSLDSASAIEQLSNSPEVKKAVAKITSKTGNHHLAFSIINGDAKSFEAGQPISIHIGLFDTKNLTWKWITKVQDKKGMLSKWEVTYSAMVNNSFDAVQNLRQPASQK